MPLRNMIDYFHHAHGVQRLADPAVKHVIEQATVIADATPRMSECMGRRCWTSRLSNKNNLQNLLEDEMRPGSSVRSRALCSLCQSQLPIQKTARRPRCRATTRHM
jgi:hypothetical protein